MHRLGSPDVCDVIPILRFAGSACVLRAEGAHHTQGRRRTVCGNAFHSPAPTGRHAASGSCRGVETAPKAELCCQLFAGLPDGDSLERGRCWKLGLDPPMTNMPIKENT